jgi:rhomboid protease GluP
MTDPEIILHLCAEAAPTPWYPKTYAQVTGIERDSLDPPLERLRLAGLIRLTEWTQGHGQGYVLTPEGTEFLHNPQALAHLRAGQLPPPPKAILPPAVPAAGRPTPWQRGEIVRAVLDSPTLPVVTLTILFANILVFLWGLVLAVLNHVEVYSYLFLSNPNTTSIHIATGAVSARDIVEGAWWRLLSCCFVHGGLIHLGVNMYGLYAVGPLVEQMWGRFRFLALYLIAGLGGSCAQLIVRPFQNGQPIPLVGASGALFGVMASMVVWILLNRSHLPRQLTAAWLRQLLNVFVINTFISFMPGIGGAAHFGGAVVGALTGVLLNEQRFGHGFRRGLALLGLFVLPVWCLGTLDYFRVNDKDWQAFAQRLEADARRQRVEADRHELKNEYLDPADRADREALEVLRLNLTPLLRKDPLQRDPHAVEQAIPALEQAQAHLAQAAEQLHKAGPYEEKWSDKVRQVRAEQLDARAKLLHLAVRCLQREANWTDQEQNEFDVQSRLVRQLDTEWQRLFMRPNPELRSPVLH